jgi:hypothetical protein
MIRRLAFSSPQSSRPQMSSRLARAPFGVLLPLATAALAMLAPASSAAQQQGARPTTRTTPAKPAAGKPAVATAARAAPRDTVERLPNGRRKPAGWPVKGPAPLPGAILPGKRILAYYGNPLSKRMGVLGEYEVEEMLRRLDAEVARWNKADPKTPVQPALHLIAVVAAGEAGPSGKWRTRMDSALIEKVYGWAKRRNAILFLDVQVGLGTLEEELPRLEKWFARPDVHLGIDPEFAMKPSGAKPGKKIGRYDAADINHASRYLQDIVTKYRLPPKVLVVHRFTRGMVTNSRDIRLDPRVQVVMHMDGWGGKPLKIDTYYDYIASEPVQFTGFKLFYHNDQKKPGTRLMTPAEVVGLYPSPVYIQYQ